MKLFLRTFSFLIISFMLIGNSFALATPTEIKVDSLNSNSISLSWNSVEGAYMYYVQYSKDEVTDEMYDNITEYSSLNSVTISDLEKESTYYFSVVALDENGEESNSSNDIVVNTTAQGASNSQNMDFVLNGVKAISNNTIELSFSLPIDNSTDAIREFKIVNKNDSLDSFESLYTYVDEEDSSKLLITLDKNIKNGSEYEVTVIAIVSLDEKTIESGIDSVASFFVNNELEVENNAPEANNIQVENPQSSEPKIDLNSASEKTTNNNNGGTVETGNMDKTIITTASTNSTLPKTGPEYVIMIILSIILGAIFFMFKYKRAN